jgi:hypothetical protein
MDSILSLDLFTEPFKSGMLLPLSPLFGFP